MTGSAPKVHGSDFDSARRAKRLVVQRFAGAQWWRGAGLAPVDSGWAVRLDVARPVEEPLPDEVDGVPVEVHVVGDVTALGGTPLDGTPLGGTPLGG